MKILSSVAATLLIGTFTALCADEAIDTQIEEIKAAPAEKRVELMNQFKLQLATMNAEDREDAINELRLQIRVQTRIEEGEGDQVRTEVREMKTGEADQMNQMQQMNQINQMRQSQIGQMGAGAEPAGNMPSSAR